jgi:hypothetical protein
MGVIEVAKEILNIELPSELTQTEGYRRIKYLVENYIVLLPFAFNFIQLIKKAKKFLPIIIYQHTFRIPLFMRKKRKPEMWHKRVKLLRPQHK